MAVPLHSERRPLVPRAAITGAQRRAFVRRHASRRRTDAPRQM
jgi:hypothetical protein